MKIIAVINEKGGTAKTTTTVSLAAALGEIGQSVLVVDLDGQAASSRWLGVEGDSRLADALIAGEGLEPIQNVLPNVDLAPASGKIDSVAHELRPTQGGQLRRVLAEVQSRKPYEYILLDCPPSLGNRLIGNALLAATHAIVPVEASILALDGLRILLTMLKDIRQGFDHNIELLGVLACRYDGRTRLSRLVLSELHRALPDNVFRTVIHNTIRIQECPAVSRSILEYAPDCPAARDYRMLAQELVTGEVDVERVEEFEDLLGSDAIDRSDQQTVLDFRHRAAEFFGRVSDEEPKHARPSEDITDMVVEVVMEETEQKEGETFTSSSHEPAPRVEDAVDKALVAAAAPASTPEPPAPPVEEVVEPTAAPPVEETPTYVSEAPATSQTPTPAESRGGEAHRKARRNAKLIAAGLVILFAAGAILVQQMHLFPHRAGANRQADPSLAAPEKTASQAEREEQMVMEIWEDAEAGNPAERQAAANITPPAPDVAETEKEAKPLSPDVAEATETKPPLRQPETQPAFPAAATAPVTVADASPPESLPPTAAGNDSSADAPLVEQPEEEPEVEPITLMFSGMMGARGNYSASINDHWLQIGERILEAKLVTIDPMFAEVEWQEERFRLPMGEETTLHVGEGTPLE
ncbi:MAG: ParA family protein [Phycisphaerae bacterium]|nr:ParA family protein [Phycisphaerae bacterium]